MLKSHYWRWLVGPLATSYEAGATGAVVGYRQAVGLLLALLGWLLLVVDEWNSVTPLIAAISVAAVERRLLPVIRRCYGWLPANQVGWLPPRRLKRYVIKKA